MNQFPAWGKLARSEIQIGPDQHDIAVGVTVAGVKLRTCPLLNFRSERAKHLQKIFRHLMARPEVLKSSIIGETKDALGAVEHHKINSIEFVGQYSGIWREGHIAGLSWQEETSAACRACSLLSSGTVTAIAFDLLCVPKTLNPTIVVMKSTKDGV